MKRKHFFDLSFILVIAACYISYRTIASESCYTPSPRTLNIIMLIDSGFGEEYEQALKGKYYAITNRLRDALQQCADTDTPAIIIVSAALMYCLSIIKQQNKDTNDFNVLAQKWHTCLLTDPLLPNNHQLVTLIPKAIIPQIPTPNDLEHLNLNAKNLHILNTSSLSDFFMSTDADSQQPTYSCTPYSTHDLETLLPLTGKQIPKRIYLAGHGITMPRIAGMWDFQYQASLTHLNKINTELLYVASCNGGGDNLLAMHNLLANSESTFQLKEMLFTIVIGSVTDAPQYRETTPNYYKIFFSSVDSYIKERRIEKNKLKIKLLKPLAEKLYAMVPYINNIPLFHVPEQNTNLFYAIAGETIHTLTTRNYKKIIESNAKTRTIDIPSQKKCLLVYPVDFTRVNLNFSKPSLIVSMIPGTAQHYIGTIKSCSTANNILHNMFCRPLTNHNGTKCYACAAKAWFIKQIIGTDQTITNIVIHKKKTYYSTIAEFIVLMQLNNKYWNHTICDSSDNKMLKGESRKEITFTEYQSELKNIFESTRALPEALCFATVNQEDPKTESQSFECFAKNCTNLTTTQQRKH